MLLLQLERPLNPVCSHESPVSLSNGTVEELNSWQTNHHSQSHWAELLLIRVRAKRLSEVVIWAWDMQVGDFSWPSSETVYHHYQFQHRPWALYALGLAYTVASWIVTAQKGMDWFCLNHLVNSPAEARSKTLQHNWGTSDTLAARNCHTMCSKHPESVPTTTGGMSKRGLLLPWQRDLYFIV